ncbi:MAG: hypothetical protein IJS88_04800 [Alphaproteobacteria bacterium]|nr:hypothetical protein [Alphaproteobacteria bacterium]
MKLLLKIFLGLYFVLKAVIFKFVEYLLRSFIAVIGIGIRFCVIFCIMLLFIEVFVPLPRFKPIMLSFLTIYGVLFMYRFIRNFYDKDDRDFVRMLLAQPEHKLCFKNQKLSIYPYDWHWIEEV